MINGENRYGDKGKIYLIGMGPGSQDYVMPVASQIIAECDIIAGAKRHVEPYSNLGKPVLEMGNKVSEFIDDIISHENQNIAVLVSGDTGIFSLMPMFEGKISEQKLVAIPGISSVNLFCARMKITWNDAVLLTMHGKECPDFPDVCREQKKVIIFTGGENAPGEIAKELLNCGLRDVKMCVGSSLSLPDEEIVCGNPDEIKDKKFGKLSLVYIENNNVWNKSEEWEHDVHGIPDELFIRGEVPMTKMEVRSIAISKLKLNKNSIVWDIGAGTGSVSIEASLICKRGRVFAIEQEREAVELIHKNRDKFGVTNLEIIFGKASEVMDKLPVPSKVFVGGTGEELQVILDRLIDLPGKSTLVITAVTIETISDTLRLLGAKGIDNPDISQVAISKGRKVGSKHMIFSQNPIYVISCDINQKGDL